MDHRTVAFWSTKDELKLNVISSLHKEFNRAKRPGWIRGGSGVSQHEKVIDSSGKETKTRKDTVDKFDLIIDELKASYAGMTVSELVGETKLSRSSVKNMLKKLAERDLIEKIGTYGNVKYVVKDSSNPTDGYHVFRNKAGVILKEGYYKNGELYNGKEYNWIIKDRNHTFKYNCSTNDYEGDKEPETEITAYAQYDSDFFNMYLMSTELEYEGLDHYYVADIAACNGYYNT